MGVLTEVTTRIYVPFGLSLSVDATSGHLNQLILFSIHLGGLTGNVHKFCGANHSFMAIVIEVILSIILLPFLLKCVSRPQHIYASSCTLKLTPYFFVN